MYIVATKRNKESLDIDLDITRNIENSAIEPLADKKRKVQQNLII